MQVRKAWVWGTLLGFMVCTSLLTSWGLSQTTAEKPVSTKLLLAFSSYRDRPRHPVIYFYEHDGVSQGKIVNTLAGKPTSKADSYSKPALSADGKLCAYTYELENNTSKVQLWDLAGQKEIDLAKLNVSPNAVMTPSLSADGMLIAFDAFSYPNGPGLGWYTFLFDRQQQKLVELPSLNTSQVEARLPTLSADGNFLVYTTSGKTSLGRSDVHLYDRADKKVHPLPALNSAYTETQPSVTKGGKRIAFVSDRPGGVGGRDIYVFDRDANKLVPVSGLNAVGNDMLPSFSPDGRYLVFVSERLQGEGLRDVYLYDLQAQKLLPTPGLNSKTEDYDPCVVVLGAE